MAGGGGEQLPGRVGETVASRRKTALFRRTAPGVASGVGTPTTRKAAGARRSARRPFKVAAASSKGSAAVRRFVSQINWPRVLRRGGVVFAALLLLPVLQVGCVRFADPPGTPLMFIRRLEARVAGQTPAPVRYRWLGWRALPDDFLRGAWASEDARFFQHHGFDWKEFHVAMAQSERTGKPPRGTSTISMQCARSLFLWQGHSYVRKGLEAYYTFWMEAMLSKRRILELYANVVELGDGVYGIGAAAERWFERPAAELTREECAVLAAMLPAPRRWNPRRPSPRLMKRWARVRRELPLMHWPAGVR